MVLITNGVIGLTPVLNAGGTGKANDYVGWSAKIHSAGNTAGAGNIMLGDGSAQQCSSANFRQNYLHNAVDNGFFDSLGGAAATAANGDVHLIFP